MAEITQVVIGIQARSTSTRFPRKVHRMLDGKPILQHVIDSANRAATYINRHSLKLRELVSVAVLVPAGDEITTAFQGRALIIEGPEDDVLARYRMAAERLSADYMVRVTSDCPLLPDHMIQKHIKVAVKNGFDYCSNVDEQARTAIDGHDVEVMSKRALNWIHENAKEQKHREHVTLGLRELKLPDDFRVGHIIGYLNQSHIKLSVDTPEDLERVEVEYFRRKRAEEAAIKLHGKQSVHRY